MDRIAEMQAAVDRHLGNKAAAARELGIARETLRDALRSQTGYERSQKGNDQYQGGTVTGRSTLIDCRTNETVLEWVKTSASSTDDTLAIAAAAFKEKLPRYLPVKSPAASKADLMSVYVLTDYHLGMLAWGEETGAEDWDLRIAEQMLVDWFAEAIAQAPASEMAIFSQLGDFLHWDGMDAVTPQHKNLLDADTRFPKLIRVAIRATRQIIAMLLAKHQKLHIIVADANHDPASGAWLREWLGVLYENEPRITVETSADAYYCFEWGNTSVFFHHGHKRGVKDVDGVFVAKFREVFGRTKYSYAHLGHLHSNELKETNLMQVERHRTLAAPDAYAAKGGWISGREAKCITYSCRFGEVSRVIINPDMVRNV